MNQPGRKSTPLPLHIRKMTADELAEEALAWAAQEGWNPGLNDAETFFAADPDGFFMGEINGEPVGCISAVAYNDNFGFIGLYIVKPEHRGNGYGKQLWNKAMAYLGNRNIGLDGVVAQQENYKKSGFKPAYKNIRFEGKSIQSKHQLKEKIIELSAFPFAEIAAYDKHCFPAERNEFLKKWIEMSNAQALGILDSQERLAGFGVIRECCSGFKIGPLFADDAVLAESLFLALAYNAGEKPVYLDVPEVNTAALALTEKYKLLQVFETLRMYTKEAPDLLHQKIFGVTTFELG